MTKYIHPILLLLVALLGQTAHSHPLGDMFSHNNTLYWVYVCPIQSQSHQACIMKMDSNGDISQWRKSNNSASDWILGRSVNDQFYFIERYYDHSKDHHMAQMMTLAQGKSQTIRPWYPDQDRIGESGFVILPDQQILFAYRGKLKLSSVERQIQDWPLYQQHLQKFRPLADGSLLLIGKEDIRQIDTQGKLLKRWPDIIQKQFGSAPIMGNRVFDATYHAGNLYIAYWGNRRFEMISPDGQRRVLKQYDPDSHWLPHSIVVHNDKVYGLASYMKPNDIRPQLLQFEVTHTQLVWGDKS